MVRKPLRTLVLLVCLLAAILPQANAASAASYEPYDGNISSTYLTLFRDLVGKLPLIDDYVFFRSDQYEYILVSGNLEYSNGVFTAPEVTVYRIVTNTSYSSTYTYFQTVETDFRLSVGNMVVYSNLAHYPELVERNTFYSLATLILLLACMAMYMVRSIFGFTMRR